MKVKCISTPITEEVTKGKVYEVIDISVDVYSFNEVEISYLIISDQEEEEYVSSYLFKTIREENCYEE